MSVITVQGVSKSFGKRPVLKDLDLDIEKGELLAIIGPSGIGKTTVLRIMNGLLAPDSGSVSVFGSELHYSNNDDLDTRKRMALITQRPVAFRDTVFENIAYPLIIRNEEDIDEKVERTMEMVSLQDMGSNLARALSGGELQRMAFARATVFDPEILLLDEFTAHLDPYNIKVLESAVFSYMKDKGATVIMVTHNLFQAKRISKSTAFLLDGKVIEKGETKRVFNDPMDDRTRAFVEGEMVF